ncbi:hypothetical protein RclHR1_06820010 [Rhizophagus clarus]|nr:hypothetical protein RclHR1_06820010 [Rhizophagus clarus]
MNEPHFVRKHYMDLTKRINKLLNDEHIQNSINQKRKQPPDCEDNERMSPKKIKDMNDRNSFIFFRGELDKYLSQLGYSLTMQENLDLASTLWSKQSENVKNMYKEKSQQDNYSMSYNMSYD